MDLKALRECKLKQTRPEFAHRIGESEADVELWESTGNPPLSVIQKIAQETGLDFNMILGYEKPVPKAIDLNDTWEKAEFTKKSLAGYLADALDKIVLPAEQRKAYIDGLQRCIERNLVKPKVMIVGRSDTGKSTLINAMLGAEKMPVSWTPTTAIAVYIKHIKDKPSFIPADENVWVFTNHLGEEELWDVRRLQDEEYCCKWKIAAGDIGILRSYGIRQNEAHAFEAGSAVVFVDAPILKNCDIIDLPGFGTETGSDDLITFKATQGADVIIYLSQANGFMRYEDITYLKENIKGLPVFEKCNSNKLKPLENLFIVASQAHTVNAGDASQLDNILKAGCRNFTKTLPDHYWSAKQSLSGYSAEDYGTYALPQRFFTYTTDIPSLCEKFNNTLKALLNTLPEIINNRTKAIVKMYVSERKPNLQAEIENYERMVGERDKYISLLRDIKKNEPNRAAENDRCKKEVLNTIVDLRKASIQEFQAYCAAEINVDAIIRQIKKEGIKNEKEAVELFASQFQGTVQQQVETILAKRLKEFSDVARDYCDRFSQSVNRTYSDASIRANFDVTWAFTAESDAIGGILGGIGAVALGAVLGPIGVVAGLAIGAILGLISLFMGGWEKDVAKNILNAFETNQIQEKYVEAIKRCWDENKKAFNSAAQSLDSAWSAYIDNLDKVVNDYNARDLENLLKTLRNLKNFFDNIPL